MNVWNALEFNPHARAMEEAARRFVPDLSWLDEFARPYCLSDQAQLAALLKRGGFAQFVIEEVGREVVSDTARHWARGSIFGSPRGAQFEAAGIATEPVVDLLADLLAKQGGVAPCRLSRQALVVSATVP